MKAPILATECLGVSIAGLRVCSGLNLAVYAGQCWAILGRNGTGKTTLLHTLAGLRPPATGTIELCGRPLNTTARREIARLRGLLAQDDSDAFPATVLETVLIGRHPHLPRWQWEGAQDLRLAREALAAADMAGMEARDVRTLSGGERRRVSLAALLAQQPQLYLLDEPSTHLDLSHQLTLLDRLTAETRRHDKALLMVVHDVNLAERYCDHALLLARGEATAGPADEMLCPERLSAVFGLPLKVIAGPRGRVFVAE